MAVFPMMDILKSSFEKDAFYKWFLVVSFVPVIGPVLYLLMGEKFKLKPN